MNRNNNKALVNKRGTSEVPKTGRKAKIPRRMDQIVVAGQPSLGSTNGKHLKIVLPVTSRILTRSKAKSDNNYDCALDAVNSELNSATELMPAFCDNIVDQATGGDDSMEEQELDSYDRIQTTVDPADDADFLDDNFEDNSDVEEGELGMDSETEGSQEPIIDDVSTVDSEITFRRRDNKSNTRPTDFSVFEGNPAFETYIKKMVAQEMAAERQSPVNKVAEKQKLITTPKGKGKGTVTHCLNDVNKSPSDTTIYAPALQKIQNDADKTKLIVSKILNDQNSNAPCGIATGPAGSGDVTDHIAHFIEGVRLEAKARDPGNRTSTGGSATHKAVEEIAEPVPGTSGDSYQQQMDIAKQKANQLILDAERFKASVNVPPGGCLQNPDLLQIEHPSGQGYNPNFVYGNAAMNDDDFFHVTCHVDPALRSKIERGEFVELERLLPKTRGSFGLDDSRMNLVQRDGQVFFVPAANGQKINSVRKWEQAFRIYAAIYSQANPSRAAEIWQYVHTINVAASGYLWENVSHYDITFRHLMSQNPARSWSKIYNQMWNMALRDPLPRNNQNFNSSTTHSNGNNRKSGGQNGNGQRKPRYCWGHNRGNCKDGVEKCKFIHRCSYCDKADHIKSSCTQNPNNK